MLNNTSVSDIIKLHFIINRRIRFNSYMLIFGCFLKNLFGNRELQ